MYRLVDKSQAKSAIHICKQHRVWYFEIAVIPLNLKARWNRGGYRPAQQLHTNLKITTSAKPLFPKYLSCQLCKWCLDASLIYSSILRHWPWFLTFLFDKVLVDGSRVATFLSCHFESNIECILSCFWALFVIRRNKETQSHISKVMRSIWLLWNDFLRDRFFFNRFYANHAL